jgi:hypothetical protein
MSSRMDRKKSETDSVERHTLMDRIAVLTEQFLKLFDQQRPEGFHFPRLLKIRVRSNKVEHKNVSTLFPNLVPDRPGQVFIPVF